MKMLRLKRLGIIAVCLLPLLSQADVWPIISLNPANKGIFSTTCPVVTCNKDYTDSNGGIGCNVTYLSGNKHVFWAKSIDFPNSKGMFNPYPLYMTNSGRCAYAETKDNAPHYFADSEYANKGNKGFYTYDKDGKLLPGWEQYTVNGLSSHICRTRNNGTIQCPIRLE